MKQGTGPSDRRYSIFMAEEAIVTDVDRNTWTCKLRGTYSAKTYHDVEWSVGYHHTVGGEGIHVMPEVGAFCLVCRPSDDTPAKILCFISAPAAITAETDDPIRSTGTPGGSNTNVSYQGNRPDMNPGDIAITTRDGNFLFLRRGGVLQIGATPLAQRICVPIRNFIRDFCENYQLVTPAGESTWTIDRPELDPAGQAASSYLFQLREFATDTNATVRVRHLPLAAAGGKKAAWEVTVAPQGINTQTGSVATAKYTLLVTTSGDQAEMVGANREITISGNDKLTINGNQVTAVKGTSKLSAQSVALEAKALISLVGKKVALGDAGAAQPGMLGLAFLQWISTAQVLIPGQPPGVISPASLAQFVNVLSKTVFLK